MISNQDELLSELALSTVSHAHARERGDALAYQLDEAEEISAEHVRALWTQHRQLQDSEDALRRAEEEMEVMREMHQAVCAELKEEMQVTQTIC